MDEDDPAEECEVCGGTSFYKEAGHFYCNECQTQSQQIREQVFEQEQATINSKSTKKIQKDKASKEEDKLTSWECYNIILKNLTEELIALGAKSEIKSVVRCLWMKYLHKCQVFDLKSNRPPKVSVLGSKKDIEILYNVKSHKRKRSRTSSISTTTSVRRQRSSKRRALIKSQYADLSQSQTLTQDSSMVGETLSSLKTGSSSDSNAEISYNRYSNAQLKRIMSKKHYKEHKHDVSGEMSCHKFSGKTFPGAFVRGPTILTPFTLYSILYVGLLIVEDDIQLGDVLRFIREGHLSFGSYRHFFGEDMSDKSLNLPKKNDRLFSSEFFRQKTASLVHFLQIEKYVKMPNLIQLCSRYCKELNLPGNIVEYVEKLIIKTAPRMHFGVKTNEIPNYEGRALSFILFTLKLLFGLDGVTENKLSDYAQMLNSRLVDTKMFLLKDWLIYIRHRDNVMKTYHMPYSLKNSGNVDSDMYLNYIRNQEINCKSTSRHVPNEVKDYLQILEKLVDSEIETSPNEERFRSSLTPFLSYISTVLDSNDISCQNVLMQSFSEDSLEFIFRPNKYLKLLGNETVKNGGANDKIVIEDALHIDIHVNDQRNKSRKSLTVKVSDEIKDDKFIKEHLDSTKRECLTSTDANVFLSNWQQGHQKQFLRNRVLLELASENVKVNVKQDAYCNKESYTEHYNAFERYWLNIPTNPTNVRRYISKSIVQQIMSKLPHSFRIIVNEFTRMAEQCFYDFYSEFLVTELNLVYFEGYCSKSKKGTVPGIQKVLKDCLKKW